MWLGFLAAAFNYNMLETSFQTDCEPKQQEEEAKKPEEEEEEAAPALRPMAVVPAGTPTLATEGGCVACIFNICALPIFTI